MLYGQALLESLKSDLQRQHNIAAERQERIDSWQTDEFDCATSMRMTHHNVSEIHLKIEILENGGMSEFQELHDLEGNVVSNKLINGKYGYCWLIHDDYRAKYNKFVGDPSRESTLNKKGLQRVNVLKPAWVTFKSNGGGMYGAYSGSYVVFPSRINYWLGE